MPLGLMLLRHSQTHRPRGPVNYRQQFPRLRGKINPRPIRRRYQQMTNQKGQVLRCGTSTRKLLMNQVSLAAGRTRMWKVHNQSTRRNRHLCKLHDVNALAVVINYLILADLNQVQQRPSASQVQVH